MKINSNRTNFLWKSLVVSTWIFLSIIHITYAQGRGGETVTSNQLFEWRRELSAMGIVGLDMSPYRPGVTADGESGFIWNDNYYVSEFIALGLDLNTVSDHHPVVRTGILTWNEEDQVYESAHSQVWLDVDGGRCPHMLSHGKTEISVVPYPSHPFAGAFQTMKLTYDVFDVDLETCHRVPGSQREEVASISRQFVMADWDGAVRRLGYKVSNYRSSIDRLISSYKVKRAAAETKVQTLDTDVASFEARMQGIDNAEIAKEIAALRKVVDSKKKELQSLDGFVERISKLADRIRDAHSEVRSFLNSRGGIYKDVDYGDIEPTDTIPDSVKSEIVEFWQTVGSENNNGIADLKKVIELLQKI